MLLNAVPIYITIYCIPPHHPPLFTLYHLSLKSTISVRLLAEPYILKKEIIEKWCRYVKKFHLLLLECEKGPLSLCLHTNYVMSY